MKNWIVPGLTRAALGAAVAASLLPAVAQVSEAGTYQVVPLPTANALVWRLNTATGEVALCSPTLTSILCSQRSWCCRPFAC
jgi:hypothetical protein